MKLSDAIGPSALGVMAVVVGAVGSFTTSAWSDECDPPRFSVTDVGILAGTQFTTPNALNEAGEAVGRSCTWLCNTVRPFSWFDGAFVPLESIGGNFDAAEDVNDSGVSVGTVFEPSIVPRACRWVNGDVLLLPRIGSENSYAFAINAEDVIVGASDNLKKPVAWMPSTPPNGYTLVPLPDLNAGQQTHVKDINNARQIVGNEGLFQGAIPQLWTPVKSGWMRQTLPGGLSANAINESGTVIVGTIDFVPTDSEHAARWTLTESGWQIEDLGTIVPAGHSSIAFDVNEAGQIVGESATNHASNDRAILVEDGVMLDLNALIDAASGWLLTSATSITESGWIVGTGSLNGENGHGFLLRPMLYPPGDADFDEQVGIADLLLVIGSWGVCSPVTPKNPGCCPADVAQDGVVGIADLLLVIGNWG